MNLDYHIDLVRNPSTGYARTALDLDLVAQAQSLYVQARLAMSQLTLDGDYKAYVLAIRDYDRFVWQASHQGDKTNLFAYKKIKVSPSWTEQIWAPVFERVRQHLETIWRCPLVLVQNQSVVDAVDHLGPRAYKDVDIGIGLLKHLAGWDRPVILPVAVAESKTGHYCKTACTNVDGIVRRVRTLNPRVLAFCITDNNVSVARDALVDHVFGHGGVLVQQRGVGANNDHDLDYPELAPENFQLVEKICRGHLSKYSYNDFAHVKGAATSDQTLRSSIDAHGYFVPKELEAYI